MTRSHVARRVLPLATVLAVLAASMAPTVAQGREAAAGRPQRGFVMSGSRPIAGAQVTLYATGGKRGPHVLGTARSRADGSFGIPSPAPTRSGESRYLIASGGDPDGPGEGGRSIRLATVLGKGWAPKRVTINELTTVATAFALAQFIHGSRIDGPSPGLPNAARTLRNLVNLRSGGVGRVLREPPNGSQTPTLATFRSLANLLAGCVRSSSRCVTLFRLADQPGARPPRDTLEAAHDIATAPGHRVGSLFRESLRTRVFRPALKAGQRPDAWTLALRYDGGGGQMDGPGQTAFDRHGNAWITNNYVFTRRPRDPDGVACGDDHILKLRPDGRNAPGAPYRGGGLYGAGYGITIGRDGTTWASSFGFQGSNCPIPSAQQAANSRSLSQFRPNGTPISPSATGSDPGGWPGGQGLIFRPQGMATSRSGDILVASCGNDRLVIFRKGDPDRDVAFSARRLDKPFDVTIDPKGRAWVTANGSNAVFAFDRKGRIVRRLAGARAKRAGIVLPMGVASDSRGNIWVSNSGVLRAPCDAVPDDGLERSVQKTRRAGFKGRKASLTMIRPGGRPHPGAPFKGAGLILPWGVAIDGDDNVWVANFDGKRLSHLCGARTSTCPVGKRRVGAPISPASGYGFAGLVRSTGVAIDPSGNVWLTNNWRIVANPANPGGHQMVEFLGLAKPVKTPLIGAPRVP